MKCPSCGSKNVDVKPNRFDDNKCNDCGIKGQAFVFIENGDMYEVENLDKEFDRILKMQEENRVHPLLNDASKHYSMFDGIEAIEVLEAIMTTEELMAWCRGNVYKYRLRIGSKDDVVKEAKKIETYEAYYKYLKEK